MSQEDTTTISLDYYNRMRDFYKNVLEEGKILEYDDYNYRHSYYTHDEVEVKITDKYNKEITRYQNIIEEKNLEISKLKQQLEEVKTKKSWWK